MRTFKCLNIYVGKENTMIFKEINFKNTYAKNIKNKKIININFEDSCDIYNLQVLVFL
jgi:hypothetical protein